VKTFRTSTPVQREKNNTQKKGTFAQQYSVTGSRRKEKAKIRGGKIVGSWVAFRSTREDAGTKKGGWRGGRIRYDKKDSGHLLHSVPRHIKPGAKEEERGREQGEKDGLGLGLSVDDFGEEKKGQDYRVQVLTT